MRNIICLLILAPACSITTGKVRYKEALLTPVTQALPPTSTANSVTPQVVGQEVQLVNCGWQLGGEFFAELDFWPAGPFDYPLGGATSVAMLLKGHAGMINAYALREVACAHAQGIKEISKRIGAGGHPARLTKLETNFRRLTVAWAKDQLQATGQGGPSVQPAAPGSAPAAPQATQPPPTPATTPASVPATSACEKIKNAGDFKSLAEGFKQLAAETTDPRKRREREDIAATLQNIAATPGRYVFSAYKSALGSHCE
jgi:hypothetical protein